MPKWLKYGIPLTMTVEDPAGDGHAELDRTIEWVQKNADLLPAGTCRR